MYQTPTSEDALADRLEQLADNLAEQLTEKADLAHDDLLAEIQTLSSDIDDCDVQLGLILGELQGLGGAVEDIQRRLS